jgi:hypothetical protein
MKPKFADTISWQQAEMLMQPVFIRLIDNIRKQLEQSTWQGTYREQPIWAEDVSEATQNQVIQLQLQLKTASKQEAEAIEQALAQLPHPHLDYQLCLKKQTQEINIDLWELCYQICFRNYIPPFQLSDDHPVEIDQNLIDEMGEVDWLVLDEKAKRLIEQIFKNLPEVD